MSCSLWGYLESSIPYKLLCTRTAPIIFVSIQGLRCTHSVVFGVKQAVDVELNRKEEQREYKREDNNAAVQGNSPLLVRCIFLTIALIYVLKGTVRFL